MKVFLLRGHSTMTSLLFWGFLTPPPPTSASPCVTFPFFKNGCNMRCLWPSENQRNWVFDTIYWALRHSQNQPNWYLANILAWKTSFIIGLRYSIHFWKSFCLKLALNLTVQQTLCTTFILYKILQITWFYVNKSTCHILGVICEPSRIPRNRWSY